MIFQTYSSTHFSCRTSGVFQALYLNMAPWIFSGLKNWEFPLLVSNKNTVNEDRFNCLFLRFSPIWCVNHRDFLSQVLRLHSREGRFDEGLRSLYPYHTGTSEAIRLGSMRKCVSASRNYWPCLWYTINTSYINHAAVKPKGQFFFMGIGYKEIHGQMGSNKGLLKRHGVRPTRWGCRWTLAFLGLNYKDDSWVYEFTISA